MIALQSNEQVEFPRKMTPIAKITVIEDVYGEPKHRVSTLGADGSYFIYYPKNHLGFFLNSAGTEATAVVIKG